MELLVTIIILALIFDYRIYESSYPLPSCIMGCLL